MDCYWTADFETTTDVNDCRVWAYALCNIEDPSIFHYGKSIEEFFEYLENRQRNLKLWFHNLKFDSQFVLAYLLSSGYEWISNPKEKRDHTFTTLITDTGQYYCLRIYFTVRKTYTHKVDMFDSLKIFPNFSVERVAEGFNLPIRKLSIDYKAKRPVGHELTEQEVDYIRNDVEIMARALKIMFEQGHTRMTIASDAMKNFKDNFVGFRKKFPLLAPNVDSDIRKSYRGGYTYVNDKWKGKQVGHGIVIDVNSLYPSTLISRECPMPYGEPRFFEGEYKEDSNYPLYVQEISVCFEIKPNHIPSVQLKKHLSFQPTEYVKSSKGQIVRLTLTKPDFELFKQQYDISYIKYHGGWKFKSSFGYFDNYINYWMSQKVKAGKEGNKPLKAISKLLLNSLYGRFSLSGEARQKMPYVDDNGVVRLALLPPETRETCYIPIGCFVTAYGRRKTITTSQMIIDYTLNKYGEDRYYYSDTDSIHANLSDEDLEELKDIIHIDDFEIGYWAVEARFDKAIFLHAKCYIESIDGKINVTVAGLPKYMAPLVTFENFKRGFTTVGKSTEELIAMAKENGATDEELEKLHHKLTYHYVKGGVILEDTDFTIK